MGKVIQLNTPLSDIQHARDHLANMADLIKSIPAQDDNTLTLRDVAEENVSLAFELLDKYLRDRAP